MWCIEVFNINQRLNFTKILCNKFIIYKALVNYCTSGICSNDNILTKYSIILPLFFIAIVIYSTNV